MCIAAEKFGARHCANGAKSTSSSYPPAGNDHGTPVDHPSAYVALVDSTVSIVMEQRQRYGMLRSSELHIQARS